MNYEDDTLDALEDPENIAMLLQEALEVEDAEEEPADSHYQTLQPLAKRSRPSEPLPAGSEHNPNSELESPVRDDLEYEMPEVVASQQLVDRDDSSAGRGRKRLRGTTWFDDRKRHCQALASLRHPLAIHKLKSSAVESAQPCVVCLESGNTSEVAVMRCYDCAGSSLGTPLLLCPGCDEKLHPYAHFHRREENVDGFWRSMRSETFVDGATSRLHQKSEPLLAMNMGATFLNSDAPMLTTVTVSRYIFLSTSELCFSFKPERCDHCGESEFLSPPQPTEQKLRFYYHGENSIRRMRSCLDMVVLRNLVYLTNMFAWIDAGTMEFHKGSSTCGSNECDGCAATPQRTE